METLFFVLMGVIFFVYLGYPLTLWVLGKLKRKPLTKAGIAPKISVIIPAHNEAKCIRTKIENCLTLNYPKDKLEIIVGSDGSDDGTDAIVEEYTQSGVRLNAGGKRVGKCGVLKRCVEAATGEIILFTDADATLAKDSVEKIVQNFADPHIGCVEGVRRDMNEKGFLLDSLYWKYETMIKKLNSRLRAILGATGAIFAVRKELYYPISAQRGDDFEIPVRVRVQGFGAVLEPQALAYHPWLSNTDEFGRIVRIVAWMLPSALILLRESIQHKRWLLAFQLLVHKLLRWFVPFFLISLFVVNLQLAEGVYRAFLWTQVLFYSLAFAGLIAEKLNVKLPSSMRVPYFFCLINAASLVGVLRFMSGQGHMDWIKTARDHQG